MKESIDKEILLPEGVEAEFKGSTIHLKSGNLSLKRSFHVKGIDFEKKEGKLILKAAMAGKREKKIAGTIAAHIRNMLAGIQNPFEYKLQICSVHFPIAVTIDDKRKLVVVKNFLGETDERTAPILPGAEVKVQQDIITVVSADKELAGQTAANIESATRIKARDRRIFQDGIFITEKAGEKI